MTAKENREVKDSVFVDLFYLDETAEANERSLYQALKQKPLELSCEIRRFRIDQEIYMKFQNDISFEGDQNWIAFGEPQSILNQNMPLLYLMQFHRAYERMLSVKAHDKRGLAEIPIPEFYTFYNGEAHMEKEQILKLSDAFLANDGLAPSLEITVRVININPSAHHELLERCPVLREYGQHPFGYER